MEDAGHCRINPNTLCSIYFKGPRHNGVIGFLPRGRASGATNIQVKIDEDAPSQLYKRSGPSPSSCDEVSLKRSSDVQNVVGGIWRKWWRNKGWIAEIPNIDTY